MKRFVLRIALAALMLVPLSSGPQMVFGEVIFDNLAGTSLGGGDLSTSSTQFAQQFQTTATGYVLDSVTVQVRNLQSGTGNYSLSVFSSASDDPGSLIGLFGSGSWSAVGVPYENKTINGLLTLSPSTTYFMVMSVTDSFVNREWHLTSTDPGLVARSTSNGGTNWVPASGFPMMQVTAVPEPAMGTLAVGGLVALWGLRRRGRRRLTSGPAVTGNAA